MDKKKQTTGKFVSVSVMGDDRPGIVAGVAKVLYENACNIEALSQTVIMGQFAMIVVVSPLKGSKPEALEKALAVLARETRLEIHVRLLDSEGRPGFDPGEAEPFVITVRGEDRPGLVSAITAILAGRGINITRLGAEVVPLGQQLEYIQIYEVDIPKQLDFALIQRALRDKGEEIGVTVDMQHRDVFRAINQI
ncbi:MAG: ACT domain-containing protein [Deltaproteobacteria bacterium]|nr:ACT domain-containing protein [Deltaproteobacteria bacterium]